MKITLKQLWARISWYPQKFVCYWKDKHEEKVFEMTEKVDMDKFEVNHGDEEISDFLIDFDPSRIWIEITKEDAV